MYNVEIPCTVCNTLVSKKLPNKSSAVEKYKTGERKCFCTRECRKSWYEDKHQMITCKNCGEQFRYFPSNDTKFCSKTCYSQHMKDNLEEYNLLEKVAYMRLSTDRQQSTEKMLRTKLEKGLIIDWKNAEWKQWYRRCNAILQKIRGELIETWDGIDYIDGEYIKDCLKLPYYHKKYPTLDHVVPKQILFMKGYTPEEACEVSNLKWTTRSNNSKKHNKL